MNVLGIDIGGSGLKGAPVDTSRGRLMAEPIRIDTPEPRAPRRLAQDIANIARHFDWRGPIGVGTPGVVHGPRIVAVANLHRKLVNCDVRSLVAEATKCPVTLTNDAAAAATAEMRFGAGRGFKGKTLILILGTGVGSALAMNGAVIPCEFGQLPWRGGPAERQVAASARSLKSLTWPRWGTRLGEYVQILEQMLWPEMIIIGGGVSTNHRKFFKYIGSRATLRPAEFFNNAGIVGAALAFTCAPSS